MYLRAGEKMFDLTCLVLTDSASFGGGKAMPISFSEDEDDDDESSCKALFAD